MISKNTVIEWIRKYFEENGPTAKAVIGISGGKDSTVAAALCVEALGPDRVVGVLMPQGVQSDIEDSYRVCEFLNIPHYEVNVGGVVDALTEALPEEIFGKNNSIYYTNTPARIRMAILYSVAGLIGGRVCNTSNLCEIFVGYSTKWGDGVGDFGPLRNFTVEEVIELGRQCGLPEDLLIKPPADGLSGKTDEENLGLSYSDIGALALNTAGYQTNIDTFTEVMKKHHYAQHKIKSVNIPSSPRK